MWNAVCTVFVVISILGEGHDAADLPAPKSFSYAIGQERKDVELQQGHIVNNGLHSSTLPAHPSCAWGAGALHFAANYFTEEKRPEARQEGLSAYEQASNGLYDILNLTTDSVYLKKGLSAYAKARKSLSETNMLSNGIFILQKEGLAVYHKVREILPASDMILDTMNMLKEGGLSAYAKARKSLSATELFSDGISILQKEGLAAYHKVREILPASDKILDTMNMLKEGGLSAYAKARKSLSETELFSDGVSILQKEGLAAYHKVRESLPDTKVVLDTMNTLKEEGVATYSKIHKGFSDIIKLTVDGAYKLKKEGLSAMQAFGQAFSGVSLTTDGVCDMKKAGTFIMDIFGANVARDEVCNSKSTRNSGFHEMLKDFHDVFRTAVGHLYTWTKVGLSVYRRIRKGDFRHMLESIGVPKSITRNFQSLMSFCKARLSLKAKDIRSLARGLIVASSRRVRGLVKMYSLRDGRPPWQTTWWIFSSWFEAKQRSASRGKTEVARYLKKTFKGFCGFSFCSQGFGMMVDVMVDLIPESVYDLILLAALPLSVSAFWSLPGRAGRLGSTIWPLMKRRLNTAALMRILDIISQEGFTGAAKEAASVSWKWLLESNVGTGTGNIHDRLFGGGVSVRLIGQEGFLHESSGPSTT